MTYTCRSAARPLAVALVAMIHLVALAARADAPLVAGNGRCLDLDRGSYDGKVNGGKIQQWDCTGGPNQQWHFDSGRLVAGNGKCLDIDRGSYDGKVNGGKIQQWDCNGGPSQQWGGGLVAAPAAKTPSSAPSDGPCAQTLTDALRCGQDCVENLVNCVESLSQCGTESVQCGTESVQECTTKTLDDIACAAKRVIGKGCSFQDCKSVTRNKYCNQAKMCKGAPKCDKVKQCTPKTCVAFNSTQCALNSFVDIVRNAEIGGQATCRPANNLLNGAGCCGSPGTHGCVVTSAAATLAGKCTVRPSGGFDCPAMCVGPAANQVRNEGFCDLPIPTCGPGLPAALSFRGDDVTFYATSDLHWFRPSFALADQARHVREMNTFADGKKDWASFFAVAGMDTRPIAAPTAVIVNGDMTLAGQPEELGPFRLLYEKGWIKDSTIYPVFFGLGNHDTLKTFANIDNATRLFNYQASYLQCAGIARDPQSGAYSWDLGSVHFVQLNVYPGDHGERYPTGGGAGNSLKWLQSDLERNVGGSQRPVVILQHYRVADKDTSDTEKAKQPYWTTGRKALFDILKRYVVVGVFTGDVHSGDVTGVDYAMEEFVTSTGGSSQDRGTCQGIAPPAPGEGSFVAARVSREFLDVGHVYWSGSSAGVRPLPTDPLPIHSDALSKCYDSRYPSYYGDKDARGCRKAINRTYEIRADLTVAVAPGTAATARTLVVRRTNPSGVLSGPLAVKILGLCNDQGLRNRTFVDGCSVRPGNQTCDSWSQGADASSPYLQLSDAQLNALNHSGQVALSALFAAPPTQLDKNVQNGMLSVVRLVPRR